MLQAGIAKNPDNTDSQIKDINDRLGVKICYSLAVIHSDEAVRKLIKPNELRNLAVKPGLESNKLLLQQGIAAWAEFSSSRRRSQ